MIRIGLLVIAFAWGVMAGAGDGGGFLGVNAHVTRDEFPLADQEFQMLDQAKIRWVRADFDWSGVEKRRGEWDFSRLDSVVEIAGRNGIRLLPILDYDVPWARPAIRNLEAYREYVRRVVKRYHTQIRVWEVWNEPDSAGTWRAEPSGADYAKLLAAAYDEIKSIDPELTVLFGGTSRIPWQFWDEALRAGAAEHCDAFNLHPYRWEGGPESPSLPEDLKRFRALAARYGVAEKPLWITEIGWPTHRNSDLYWRGVYGALLEAAGAPPDGTILLADDAQYGIHPPFDPAAVFPGRTVKRVRYAELTPESFREVAGFVPTYDEAMPLAYFELLGTFVERGGTLLLPGGGPLYYDLQRDPESGSVRRIQASDVFRARLRIGWRAWWRDKRVPEFTTQLRSDLPVFPQTLWSHIYLDDSRLKPGDRLIPLAEGVRDDFAGIVAGVIRYGEGGAVGVITGTPYPRSVSEELQAAMLVRSALLAAAGGVKKFFWYELQSTETSDTDKEAHFGLLRRNLVPQLAFAAAAWLSCNLPEGADVEIQIDSEQCYHASWCNSDGKRMTFLWSPTGNFERARRRGTWFDLYGNPLPAGDRVILSPIPVCHMAP